MSTPTTVILIVAGAIVFSRLLKKAFLLGAEQGYDRGYWDAIEWMAAQDDIEEELQTMVRDIRDDEWDET